MKPNRQMQTLRAARFAHRRSFFNVHIDDEWFREIYSPLHVTANVEMINRRAVEEAETFMEEVTGKVGAEVRLRGKRFPCLQFSFSNVCFAHRHANPL